MRYSKASAQCRDLLDRAQQPTQKLLKQGNVPPWLESSLLQFYSRHHNLNDRYEIPIPQMKINIFLFPLSVARLLQGLTAYMSSAVGVLSEAGTGYHSRTPKFIPWLFDWVRVVNLFNLCVAQICVFMSCHAICDLCIKTMLGDEFMFSWK